VVPELEQLPKVIPPQVASGAKEISEVARVEVPRGVNEAINQSADAIELVQQSWGPSARTSRTAPETAR
jgi:hypothetical protein